ncbi:TPA: hypothetical protein MBI04_003572 [Klebsiella pneumoniae]|nr:hypothetical protein [Klebsiella pneumoniae]
MRTKAPIHYVHFLVNGVAGFVEVFADGVMWVYFAGQRIAYSAMQGKLKNTVYSVMVQHQMVSAWRN